MINNYNKPQKYNNKLLHKLVQEKHAVSNFDMHHTQLVYYKIILTHTGCPIVVVLFH